MNRFHRTLTAAAIAAVITSAESASALSFNWGELAPIKREPIVSPSARVKNPALTNNTSNALKPRQNIVRNENVPVTAFARAPSAGSNYSALDGPIVGGGEPNPINYGVQLSFDADYQTVVAGETAVFEVDVHGEHSMMFLAYPASAENDNLKPVSSTGPIVQSSEHAFTLSVETFDYTPAGVYHFETWALMDGDEVTEKFEYIVEVVEQNPPTYDPVSNSATVSFFPHPDDGVVPVYTGNVQVGLAGAYYDENGNGAVDPAVSPNVYSDVTFPGFPDSSGNVHLGSAYAFANGSAANLVVSAKLDEYKFVVAHFRVQQTFSGEWQIVPVQALAGDFESGPVLIHEGAFDSYDVYAELPNGSNNGYVRGSLIITPFFYDAFDGSLGGTIYGNEVYMEFDLALQADHIVQ